ncbi:hypothetical protein HJG52_09420 [Knoellia sp. DB2414S]|uniref:DUF2273 domain-containing protein n=1 Tax=Knoellia koreensis TaxID=2730921 RepID=A0A849HHU9_9MICO|nr:hypothetical protein [Knoellia sp. DB2414S]
MNSSIIWMLAGLLLGVAAAAGGFTGFLVALVLGGAGFVVGRWLDGDVDLDSVLRGRGRG